MEPLLSIFLLLIAGIGLLSFAKEKCSHTVLGPASLVQISLLLILIGVSRLTPSQTNETLERLSALAVITAVLGGGLPVSRLLNFIDHSHSKNEHSAEQKISGYLINQEEEKLTLDSSITSTKQKTHEVLAGGQWLIVDASSLAHKCGRSARSLGLPSPWVVQGYALIT